MNLVFRLLCAISQFFGDKKMDVPLQTEGEQGGEGEREGERVGGRRGVRVWLCV
jgi:hypothetical protein